MYEKGFKNYYVSGWNLFDSVFCLTFMSIMFVRWISMPLYVCCRHITSNTITINIATTIATTVGASVPHAILCSRTTLRYCSIGNMLLIHWLLLERSCCGSDSRISLSSTRLSVHWSLHNNILPIKMQINDFSGPFIRMVACFFQDVYVFIYLLMVLIIGFGLALTVVARKAHRHRNLGSSMFTLYQAALGKAKAPLRLHSKAKVALIMTTGKMYCPGTFDFGNFSELDTFPRLAAQVLGMVRMMEPFQ